jgi:hypothetical protein
MANELPKEKGGFAEAMMLEEGEEKTRRLEKAASDLRAEMEKDAEQIRALIVAQPPTGLLGYLWSQFFMGVLRHHQDGGAQAGPAKDIIKEFQFVLEYVHAVWSAHEGAFVEGQLDEAKAKELRGVCERLSNTAMFYAMASSHLSEFNEFGDATPDVEFQAKSTWTLIRGHRYQVLEREFFEFTLAPHEGALKKAYGIGAAEIAAGMQTIADTIRGGYSDAALTLFESFNQSQELIAEGGLSLEDAMAKIRAENKGFDKKLGDSLKDIFFGGTCNVSKHTELPEPLLQDMAYEPGGEKGFFAEGEFKGTPYRTLPARIRPLVKLEDGYYATDGQFVRDSAYRSIQRGLIARRPDYKEGWNKNQKAMTETAFSKILAKQLGECPLYDEVYFRDAITGEWVETDLVGVVDDTLFVIEAKAGVMAMQSPAINFASHLRTIRELVLKAYRQCNRFLKYLCSGANMPIYRLKDGEYEEVAKLNLNNFRRVLPIGLTVEAFTPFSAMCKQIPEVKPILGKHPFISMSVDDLFVLRRFLPTGGELFHYLEVRQAIAGIPQATIFDEMDHLGAYLVRNRFDQDIREQLKKADMVLWDSFSDRVDRYFEQEGWEAVPVPHQEYPTRVAALLARLDHDRPKGWMLVDAEIRNCDAESRNKLNALLQQMAETLLRVPVRRMLFGSEHPIQIWMTTQIGNPSQAEMQRQGEISCLASNRSRVSVLRLQCDANGAPLVSSCSLVTSPPRLRNDYAELKADADRLMAQSEKKTKKR